jgi:hypothetical protein
MNRTIVTALLVAGTALPAAAQDRAALMEEGRRIATTMQQQLGGALMKEIQANGADGAIGVCRTLAPGIASELSAQSGWRVTRVSLKVRNPVLGMPDPWEQNVLMELDRRAAAGEKPETLEVGQIVDEPQGRYFRYLRALPVQPLCTNCHGSPDGLAPGIRAKLGAQYPHDRATGYSVGQLRGGISLKRPL